MSRGSRALIRFNEGCGITPQKGATRLTSCRANPASMRAAALRRRRAPESDRGPN